MPVFIKQYKKNIKSVKLRHRAPICIATIPKRLFCPAKIAYLKSEIENIIFFYFGPVWYLIAIDSCKKEGFHSYKIALSLSLSPNTPRFPLFKIAKFLPYLNSQKKKDPYFVIETVFFRAS